MSGVTAEPAPAFAPGLMPIDEVLFARDGALGRVLLNRPRAINALTDEMVASITAQLDAWASDQGIQSVSIEGAGDRGLCAGGDILQVRRAALGEGNPAEYWAREYDLDEAIARYPKTVVAVMDGIVMGGGVGLSGYAGLRLATERSRIAMPETRIGFFPDVGARYLLSRAPGELGTHLALTGITIDGPDAVAVGLADAVVRSAEIPSVLRKVGAGEEALDLGPSLSASALAAQREWIDECYAGDDPATIVGRLAESAVPGAREAAAVIRQRSPLSVAVTLEAIRRARRMGSLREVLDQDLVIGPHLARHGDLVEGVRALLVDRDNAPRWKHASVSDVSRAEVLAAFEP